MEEEIEVEYVTGETVKVGLKPLSHTVKKRLNKMIAPAKVDANDQNQKVEIPYDDLMTFQEELARATITRPESLKKNIDDLTERSFQKLVAAAVKINEVTPEEKRNLP